MNFNAIIAVALISILSGCTAFNTAANKTAAVANSPVGQEVLSAAVDIVVATAEQKGIPGPQINAIAKLALSADSSTGATLSTVAGVVNAQISKLNLPAGDAAAAEILETALIAAVQAKLGSNPQVAQFQTTAAGVLQMVITATGG